MTRKTHISIKHISKVFPDGTRALHDINLDIAEGKSLSFWALRLWEKHLA